MGLSSRIEDLLDRYRRGQLSAEQAAEFETWLMDKPDVLEALELDWMLEDSIDRVFTESPIANDSGSKRSAWLPLAAAACLLGFVLGQAVSIWRSPQVGAGLVVDVAPLRNMTSSLHARVYVEPKIDSVLFRVFAAEGYSAIDIGYKPQHGPAFEVRELSPDHHGSVAFVVPARRVAWGRTTLQVFDAASGEVLQTYELDIQPFPQ